MGKTPNQNWIKNSDDIKMTKIQDILKHNKQKVLFAIFILLAFVILYYLNVLYPIFGDDWAYSFIWEQGVETHTAISSFGDIVTSQYNHYMLWGGRTIVHTIDQLLLWMGDTAHNILNALIYVVYLFVIYRMANKGNSTNVLVFLVAALVLWYVHPVFAQTVLWITGSANYLWGTTIVLLFMYPFYAYYKGEEIADTLPKIILFFLVGVIAGWTIENMGIAAIVFIGFILILLRIERRVVPKWAILGFLGIILGYLFLILAPGNYIRLDVINDILGISNISKWELLKMRIPDVFGLFKKHILILSVIYIMLFVISLKFVKDEKRRKAIKISLLFFVTSCISFFAMLGSPTFPLRATFGPITLCVIAVLTLYANFNIYPRYFNIASVVILAVFTIFFSRDFQKKTKYIEEISEVWHNREQYVKEQKTKGVEHIVFEDKIVWNKRFEIEDISEDSTYWYNIEYAKYYNIKSVRRINQE